MDGELRFCIVRIKTPFCQIRSTLAESGDLVRGSHFLFCSPYAVRLLMERLHNENKNAYDADSIACGK